ncbi:MAG: hypothetical protein ACK4E3_10300 [Brevundimonas sp.]|jgi:hypothetical protein|uniref:hypothetical protein n=1 Tax=Brevundimonas sp. TaxID=1871086 RepID=UPI00391A3E9F
MRSIPAAGRAGALALAVCALLLASTSLAQQPSQASPWEPGGPFYYGGLTREQAQEARSAFHDRMRFTRYAGERALIHFVMFDNRHVQTSIVLGYRFIQHRDGVTHENWVMMRTGFSQGVESEPRWASSDTCPQMATVIESFRNLPALGLDFFGPGRRWPAPVSASLRFEVSSRGVMQDDPRSHGDNIVTYSALDGPVEAFVMMALRELASCWGDETPARPEGGTWL